MKVAQNDPLYAMGRGLTLDLVDDLYATCAQGRFKLLCLCFTLPLMQYQLLVEDTSPWCPILACISASASVGLLIAACKAHFSPFHASIMRFPTIGTRVWQRNVSLSGRTCPTEPNGRDLAELEMGGRTLSHEGDHRMRAVNTRRTVPGSSQSDVI